MTAEIIDTTAGPDIDAGPAQTILTAALDAVREWDERDQREAEERARCKAAEAAESAAVYVRERFGDITAQLHDRMAWTGYPPLTGEDSPGIGDVPATAVAWLAPGVWLHFEDRSRFYTAHGLLSVVTACPCGRYRERGVDELRALAAALAAALAPATVCDEKCTRYQHEKDAALEDE